MSFPTYGDYQETQVEWLGAVPSHWRIVRLNALFREVAEPGSDDLAILSVSIHSGVSDTELADDEVDRAVARSEDRSKYKRVEPNDLVYNMMRAWQGGFGAVQTTGAVSPAYVVARPTSAQSTKFIERLLRTPNAVGEMKRLSKGVTDFRLRLYWDEFKSIEVALPPPDEQTTIDAFLDRETAKIDALVEAQRRLIELLKEKRQAVISHAVTKGLDPSAPMKDSGVEWLGQVPAHWEIVPIKRVTRTIEQGWSPQCENYPVQNPDEWGVLKVGCVNGGRFTPDENKTLPLELEPLPDLGICAGDLLVSRANTRELVGGAAVALQAYPNLLLCDKLYRLRMDLERCIPLFLAFFLGGREARSQIELAATGASSSMLNIGQGVILELPVPLPPLTEQIEILGGLERELGKIDDLIAEALRGIVLLQERRAALISAAVTGKIDVRDQVQTAEAA